ncbi:Sgt1-like_protein [Hexamita inflata]|uniref:Sgt1-like protein n=1 Tax=Hexamita inflata TaxID=28002 RepID=A0AA86QV85_9EUKA|nr:Sgt1-like protein [Hexamita inflata]
MSDQENKDKPQETEEEQYARIKAIEKLEARNFPKINYKWYELGTNICIELYEKNLQEGDVTVRLHESDASQLYLTLRGEEHHFDLYGTVKDLSVTLKKTKAEIRMISTGTPAHFPVLLKCEGRINAAKEKKYKELDKIGEADKSNNLNDFFQNIFNSGDDERKKAMMKSMQESGGTVLSTNWSEVGKGKVEPKPGH